MASILEQYRISDFLEWHDQKRLNLNPEFQRGSVWTPPARSYLIDTILRQLPIPKIFLRTIVDISTKKTIREVVDGQQRLRTIIDFSQDKFVLTNRAAEFKGYKYSTLPEELQETFLSYPIAVDQLLNADTDDVLEVFSRLNSYSVQLSPPEKRHAKYSGDLKWAIREISRALASFWEENAVLTVRERVRMLDDSLTAEFFQVLIKGVVDGGQSKIDKFYEEEDASFDRGASSVPDAVRSVAAFIDDNFASYLRDTRALQPPHLLMIFAAVAHALVGINKGQLDALPARTGLLSDVDTARENLLKLATTIDLEAAPTGDLADFWRASQSSTQRIASRRTRFPYYLKALLPEPL